MTKLKLLLIYFFGCNRAKVVWGTLGAVWGTSSCPNYLWQCMVWLNMFFPLDKKFHMLLLASVCWAIWNIRNKITFDGMVVRSPIVTIGSMCAYLHYWAGLYGEEDGDRIRGGAGDLMQKVSQLVACVGGHDVAAAARQGQGGQVVLAITDGSKP